MRDACVASGRSAAISAHAFQDFGRLTAAAAPPPNSGIQSTEVTGNNSERAVCRMERRYPEEPEHGLCKALLYFPIDGRIGPSQNAAPPPRTVQTTVETATSHHSRPRR